MYQKCGKRIFDTIGSLLGILLLWPVMLIVAALVRVKLGSPVIFKQERPGRKGKIFVMYKFRTMTDACDKNGSLLDDSERLTAFGNRLRATSLDELPELINILKGDMSLVGPRPLLAEYLPLYNEEQKHRHDVRPGLTGLAQVSGRNELDFEERFQYDLDYIRNMTFDMDFKIIIKTIQKIWKQEGITSDCHSVNKRFAGNREKES